MQFVLLCMLPCVLVSAVLQNQHNFAAVCIHERVDLVAILVWIAMAESLSGATVPVGVVHHIMGQIEHFKDLWLAACDA